MQPVNICSLSSSKTLKGSESSNNFWSLLLFFPVAQFGDGNIQIPLFLSSSVTCSGACSLLAHSNTDVHTSVQKAWCLSLRVEEERLLVLAQKFLLHVSGFPDLPFQLRQLH